VQCAPGYTAPAGIDYDASGAYSSGCNACAANHYKTDAGNQACTALTTCGTGATGNSGTASKLLNRVCHCEAGHTTLGGDATTKTCSECAAGHYKTDAGNHACKAHTTCGAGATGNGGTVSNLVNRVCHCKPGYDTLSNNACNACDDGKYKTSDGNDACTAHAICGAGLEPLNTPSSTLDRTCSACEISHYTVKGSGSDGGLLHEQAELDPTLHEVRCCADTEISNSFTKKYPDSCPDVWGRSECSFAATTYTAAKQHCENDGARLCTREEIRNDCTRATGCSFDGKMIWTSSPAAGHYKANAGNWACNAHTTCGAGATGNGGTVSKLVNRVCHCEAGHTTLGGDATTKTCSECAAGHYKTGDGNDACTAHATCGAGATGNGGTVSNLVNRVCHCKAGYDSLSDNACSICSSSYKIDAGNQACTAHTTCGTGATGNGGTVSNLVNRVCHCKAGYDTLSNNACTMIPVSLPCVAGETWEFMDWTKSSGNGNCVGDYTGGRVAWRGNDGRQTCVFTSKKEIDPHGYKGLKASFKYRERGTLENSDTVKLEFRACTSKSSDSCGAWEDKNVQKSAITFENDVNPNGSGWSSYKALSNGIVHQIELAHRWIEVKVSITADHKKEDLMVDAVKIESSCD
jgi:hypothetical protein